MNTKPTILHAVEAFSGGIIVYLRHLTGNLDNYNHVIVYGKREQKERGVEIDELVKGFKNNVTFEPWHHAKRNIHPVWDFLATIVLLQKIIRYNPPVLHLHSSKAGFIGRFLAFITRRKKVFYTPNGVVFEQNKISDFQRKLFIRLEKVANFFGGKIICSSKSEAECFESIGISPVYFVNNGIDAEELRSHLAGEKDYAGDTVHIVTLARVSLQKNPDLFSEIAGRYRSDPNIKFTWIGDGDTRYKSNLTQAGVKITGWLNNKEAMNLLNNADIYLSTSLWEGLPYSVLEAMCCEKPLVLTNCVGNCDTVIESENGFLYSSFDEAIKYLDILIMDKQQRILMGQSSKKILKSSFEVKSMASEYNVLYQS